VHYNGTLDRTFFPLSDPTRRDILDRLTRAPATLSELAAPFGLTLNGVKKHVGILEDVNLVVTTKAGRARECRLGAAQLNDAAHGSRNTGAAGSDVSTASGPTSRSLDDR
jgi:DNA-binding transcriptional ArsR family regulator